jgi:putative flippase GtrA
MINGLWKKYKEVILYVFFGGCTTAVNVLSYFISTRAFHIHMMASTAIAWFLAVVFAYITNRKYVFLSTNTNVKAILLEFASFIV